MENILENEYLLNHEDINLFIREKIPSNVVKKVPLVIVIHGLTGCMDETQLLAVCNAAESFNMASVQADMYGHGRSDGDFSHHTVSKWVEEIDFLVNHFSNSGKYSDIILVGHSQGGLAVLLAASKVSDKIKSLILMAPATCIQTDAQKGLFFGQSFDAKNLPDSLTFWDEFTIGREYLNDAINLNYVECVKSFDKKVLIVHGTSDESVPFSDSQRLVTEYKNATLVPIEDDTHCFDYHVDEMEQAVKTFLMTK